MRDCEIVRGTFFGNIATANYSLEVRHGYKEAEDTELGAHDLEVVWKQEMNHHPHRNRRVNMYRQN